MSTDSGEHTAMTSDLHRMAKCLDMSAPDIRVRKIFEHEQQYIREALATVGQYVVEDDGRVYVLTASESQREEK